MAITGTGSPFRSVGATAGPMPSPAWPPGHPPCTPSGRPKAKPGLTLSNAGGAMAGLTLSHHDGEASAPAILRVQVKEFNGRPVLHLDDRPVFAAINRVSAPRADGWDLERQARFSRETRAYTSMPSTRARVSNGSALEHPLVVSENSVRAGLAALAEYGVLATHYAAGRN